MRLASIQRDQGDFASAHAAYGEALEFRQRTGDRSGVHHVLSNLGWLAYYEGDYHGASSFQEASLVIRRELNDPREIAVSMTALAKVALMMGDRPRARALLLESLPTHQTLGNRWGVAIALEGFAGLAAQNDPARALRLAGAAAAMRTTIGRPLPPAEQPIIRDWLEQARAALPAEDAALAWSAGSALTEAEAIAEALRCSLETMADTALRRAQACRRGTDAPRSRSCQPHRARLHESSDCRSSGDCRTYGRNPRRANYEQARPALAGPGCGMGSGARPAHLNGTYWTWQQDTYYPSGDSTMARESRVSDAPVGQYAGRPRPLSDPGPIHKEALCHEPLHSISALPMQRRPAWRDVRCPRCSRRASPRRWRRRCPVHAASGDCTTTGATTTCTYTFTGAEQTFTVPAGITSIQVTAIGASGGVNGYHPETPAGRGAQVSGTLAGLSGGPTLYIDVGGAPTAAGCPLSLIPCNGGFNGGGWSQSTAAAAAGHRTYAPAPAARPTVSPRGCSSPPVAAALATPARIAMARACRVAMQARRAAPVAARASAPLPAAALAA